MVHTRCLIANGIFDVMKTGGVTDGNVSGWAAGSPVVRLEDNTVISK